MHAAIPNPNVIVPEPTAQPIPELLTNKPNVTGTILKAPKVATVNAVMAPSTTPATNTAPNTVNAFSAEDLG